MYTFIAVARARARMCARTRMRGDVIHARVVLPMHLVNNFIYEAMAHTSLPLSRSPATRETQRADIFSAGFSLSRSFINFPFSRFSLNSFSLAESGALFSEHSAPRGGYRESIRGEVQSAGDRHGIDT